MITACKPLPSLDSHHHYCMANNRGVTGVLSLLFLILIMMLSSFFMFMSWSEGRVIAGGHLVTHSKHHNGFDVSKRGVHFGASHTTRFPSADSDRISPGGPDPQHNN